MTTSPHNVQLHLESLIRSSAGESTSEQVKIEEWTSLSLNDTSSDIEDWPGLLDGDVEAPTVLDVFLGDAEKGFSPVISQFLTQIAASDSKSSLHRLHSIVASDESDDRISHELLELCGFENISLATDILSMRDEIKKELRGRLFPPTSDASLHESDLLSSNAAQRRLAETLLQNANRPLFTGIEIEEPEFIPNVYASSVAQTKILSHTGSKYMLPVGTERLHYDDFEEVIIPAAPTVAPRPSETRISVAELDALARGCFPGYEALNRVQSIVYETAYLSNENILICAPTGAGKTDVAMLTILRVLSQYQKPSRAYTDMKSSIERNHFKIVYVAPMKALASEIVRKLGKRLQWLSIQVRELTGDMQMTKAEIAQTQIIVTTPEKWDVVTRKPTGEGEMASLLKLLIIDEVHLLNDDRGAVIETIIARTLRQVENTQSVIRIVGLSATLPNYLDVAQFLSVSKYKGLFYFDSSFRPVPLEQHFLGIKGKVGSPQFKKNLEHVTFQKVSELVSRGHQVMVFVHARRDTVKTALAFQEMATVEGTSDDFLCQDHPQWNLYRRSIGESKNKEMKQLFDGGFGIHHAGMLRSDRNLMERMFESRAIKVLCCTATLAWGVNLPAHAVIIKGTQVYDTSKGTFVDLSVLDVLQIFGRAGRPGLEDSGEGYICTSEDKLTHYLEAVTAQHPIESRFHTGMADALNAEISLGTVTTVGDAVQWLGYTYLFVRMKKNPLIYGIPWEQIQDDPLLGNKRAELVEQTTRKLASIGMIHSHEDGNLSSTEYGRIAAKYYVRHETVELLSQWLRPRLSEADVLSVLSESKEYEQIQLRESESKELDALLQLAPCDVKGGADTKQGKVNILLQAYISRCPVDDFALISDVAYVAQNGARLLRAMLEFSMSRRWSHTTAVLFGMSNAVEKRLWPFDQPLKQFALKADVLYGLDQWANDWTPADLKTQSAKELGALLHLNEKHGEAVLNASKQFPSVALTYALRPLTPEILKVVVRITPSFVWNSSIHGNGEPFTIWIEDDDSTEIVQVSRVVFYETTTDLELEFLVSIPNLDNLPNFTLRSISEHWIGAEDEIPMDLKKLRMPLASDSRSSIIDIPFIQVSSIQHLVMASALQGIRAFNAIQSQVYWTLFNSESNALLCAPVGSGKTTVATALVLHRITSLTNASILVVVPKKESAREWNSRLRPYSGLANMKLCNSFTASASSQGRHIYIISAAHIVDASKRGEVADKSFDLIILDSLEQLDPVFELAVTLLHQGLAVDTRWVGFCRSLVDATGLSDWLNVDAQCLFDFRPSDREVALSIFTQPFNIPLSGALYKAMIRPTHKAILGVGAEEQVIIFVPSQHQCQTVGLDLITQCALEQRLEGYLPQGVSSHSVESQLQPVKSTMLRDLLSRGIGLIHRGVEQEDRLITLRLYASGVLRVLLVGRQQCWSLPVTAASVIVMGTQYFAHEEGRMQRRVQDYQLPEIVQMQSRIRRTSNPGQFHLFCHTEVKDAFVRFLNEGLPLESQLLDGGYLESTLKHGSRNRTDLMRLLSNTYLAIRLDRNPLYYDCGTEAGAKAEVLSRLADNVVGSTRG